MTASYIVAGHCESGVGAIRRAAAVGRTTNVQQGSHGQGQSIYFWVSRQAGSSYNVDILL